MTSKPIEVGDWIYIDLPQPGYWSTPVKMQHTAQKIDGTSPNHLSCRGWWFPREYCHQINTLENIFP